MAGSDPRVKRIHRELEDASENGFSVQPVNDDIMDLKGEIIGPPDTPYEGGKFILEIKFDDNYPFSPPKIRFLTRIWHPNICPHTGKICLNILDDEWTPALNLRPVLLSIQALLSAPKPDVYLVLDVAQQLDGNPDMFKLTAKQWSRFYAGAPVHNIECDEKIKALMDYGFDEEEALTILSSNSWDVKRAIYLNLVKIYDRR